MSWRDVRCSGPCATPSAVASSGTPVHEARQSYPCMSWLVQRLCRSLLAAQNLA